jgi:hypothetical protein
VTQEPTSAQRAVALTCLALMLVYAIVGFVPDAEFPTWQMYIAADRYTYTLRDRDGEAVDIRDCVTPDSYLIRHELPALIADWLAEARPELSPLTGTVTLEYRAEDGPASRVFDFTAEKGRDLLWEPRD